MIEYPSMPNSAKAPHQACVGFDKLDGSNFRAKWTQKEGFCLYGTRSQLIDNTTEFWGEMIDVFERDLKQSLDNKFRKDKQYRHEREIIVFGEFLGDNSFAGRHVDGDPKRIVVFDILVGHKARKFVPPMEFVKEFQEIIPIPNVMYVGNLGPQLIQDVREGKYAVNEGLVCKGTKPRGDVVGGIWSCKIKTQAYFERLKLRFANEWMKYAE